MTIRAWAAAGTAILTLGVSVRTAWTETNPTLTVRVTNEAQLPRRMVDEALMMANGVYRRAGVSIHWQTASDPHNSASDLTVVITRDAAAVPFGIGEDSMGVVRTEGTRGTTAYVLYDRVRDFGERGRVDPWIVLGCAIAHELGHLLLPINSHAPDGIMRAHWDPKVIARAGGFLSFSPDQARLLRLRIASREPSMQARTNRHQE